MSEIEMKIKLLARLESMAKAWANGDVRQAQIAQACGRAGRAEQRGNARRRGVGNCQTIDDMAQAVELAGEGHGDGADRRETVSLQG